MPLSPLPPRPVTLQTPFPPLLFPSLATLLYLFPNSLAVFSPFLISLFLPPPSFFLHPPNRAVSVRVRGSVPAISSEIWHPRSIDGKNLSRDNPLRDRDDASKDRKKRGSLLHRGRNPINFPELPVSLSPFHSRLFLFSFRARMHSISRVLPP